MTLAEALRAFDEVIPYPEASGEHAVIAKCCGVSVVMDSQDGHSKLYCVKCSRTVSEVGRQWMITSWGKRGIMARDLVDAMRGAKS